MPRTLKAFFISLAIALAFLLGIYFGGHYYRLSPLISLLPDTVRSALFPGSDLLNLTTEVEGILEENFYKPLNRDDLENGAMEGLVGSLGDPYSAYLSPDDYQEYIQHHQEGAYVGVGVSLESKNGRLMVVRTLPDSPAMEAGIQPGDQIIAVDGESLEGLVNGEAAENIRGQEGSTVTLTIMRGEEELAFTMVRRALELPIVTEDMIERDGRKVGYIKLEQFSQDSGVKVQGALQNLVDQGAEAVILDLRNNGGGILDEAINVSSVFIENGTVLTVEGRDEDERTYYEARGDANESIPLVILVNGFTASASEIVAGAVKDTGRGELVGETTFGKGVIQNLRPLTNGGAIKFTSGVYFTPSGTNINEIGIEPDVPVTDDPHSEVDETLEQALLILLG